MLPLSDLADVATIVASIVGAGALVFAGFQLRHSAKVSEGQFLLELEKMMSTHDDIHLKLRPGGIWAEGQAPESVEEWSKLEDYMGFFEHCELLIRDGSLSTKRFNDIFGYRIHNIVANQHICNAKLKSFEKDSWKLFISICKRVGAEW